MPKYLSNVRFKLMMAIHSMLFRQMPLPIQHYEKW